MMTPDIFAESLFDDFFDDFLIFLYLMIRQCRKHRKKLYGRHAANLMKTDVREHDDHYEVDIDLPGFRKEDLSLELKDGYLVISAAKGIDRDEKEKKKRKICPQGTLCRQYEQIFLRRGRCEAGGYPCEV